MSNGYRANDGLRPGSSVARQALHGSAYTVAASGVTLVLGLGRSVLLARLVAPEAFGTLALALFFIGLILQLRDLGLDAGVIHRQTLEEPFLRTYFSLRAGLTVVALSLLLLGTPLIQSLYPDVHSLGEILPVLVGGYLLANLSQVQETLLRKRLAFNRIAWLDILTSTLMTAGAVAGAISGWGIWALVAEQVIGSTARFLLSWGPFRCWRPRLGWSREHARWLVDWGKPSWVSSNLSSVLDRFDDFWVGTALGQQSLGFYAKAYEFARYPRRVFANPLVVVLGPIFAQLQHDRKRLSQLFFRSAHFLYRTSLLITGALALALPELIDLLIGRAWAPMLWTFRFMLIYVSLDSMLLLATTILSAVGRPREQRRATVWQAVVFVPSVVIAASQWGRNGVAVAADAMLVVGIGCLLKPLRQTVDFSLSRLSLWPTVAVLPAWGVGYGIEVYAGLSAWPMLLLKVGAFSGLFVGTLLLAEGGDYAQGARWVWRAVRQRGRTSA